MPSRPKLLFISHDATRSGATLLLLRFLQWYAASRESYPFTILFRNGGELLGEFHRLGPVYQMGALADHHRWLVRLFRLENAAASLRTALQLREIRRQRFDLIYSNTVSNGEILGGIAVPGCPIITHVHELETCIDLFVGQERFEVVKSLTHHYIAASELVKENLVTNHNISPDSIDVVPGFISPVSIDSSAAARRQVHELLDIPEGAFIVGGCGAMAWHKGTDLFVQLAAAVHRLDPDRGIYFVWVGGLGGLGFQEAARVRRDGRLTGCERFIRFVAPRVNPAEIFNIFNLFALVSREESFGLAPMEAAYLGKPILCFDGPIGIKSVVQADCGAVLPFLDVHGMASKILELARSPETCQRMGLNAMNRAREYAIEVIAPRITAVIDRVLKTRSMTANSNTLPRPARQSSTSRNV